MIVSEWFKGRLSGSDWCLHPLPLRLVPFSFSTLTQVYVLYVYKNMSTVVCILAHTHHCHCLGQPTLLFGFLFFATPFPSLASAYLPISLLTFCSVSNSISLIRSLSHCCLFFVLLLPPPSFSSSPLPN